jgi:ABC-type transporter MlaC component
MKPSQLYLKDDRWRWRVYDVRIEGVSFMSTHRTEFSSALTLRVASRHVAPAHK